MVDRALRHTRCLRFAPNYGLPEAQDEIVAVANHKFALLVDAVLRTINDHRSARAQLLSQRVNPGHAEVGVTGTFGAASAPIGLIGAVEENLNLISPHDRENRRSLRDEAHTLTIPIPGYLEPENVAIVLGCLYQVRHSELRNRRLEANVRRCVSAHAFALLKSATRRKSECRPLSES